MEDNKYKLKIQTNWYKTPSQYQGNGGHPSFVEGCLISEEKETLYFMIYPFQNQFFLQIGPNREQNYQHSRLRVSGSDFYSGYERVPGIYFKYVNSLLESFIALNPSYKVQVKDENI